MSKLNMLEALGIPSATEGPTKATDAQAVKVLQLAVKYLLYERSEETALTAAFSQVLQERHHHFHDRGNDETNWINCSNDVCKQARDIVANTKAKEVNVSPLAAELMGRYVVNFMPMPNNLRLWITPLSEAQLPATETEKREAGKIILAS